VLSRPVASFGAETLGGIAHWYTNGDIDRDRKQALAEPGKLKDGYPKWHQKLAKATREDYVRSIRVSERRVRYPLADVTTPDLYALRDECAVRKWPRSATTAPRGRPKKRCRPASVTGYATRRARA
jgi:hypothetical protein